MSGEEILLLINDIVLKSKDEQAVLNGTKKRECPIPEYYPTYKKAVENMEAIRPHAEQGLFPEKLFKDRSPNQTEKEAEYVKKVYKSITVPMFMEYMSTRSRAWFDRNWSIKYETDEAGFESFPFQEYVEKEIKHYGSLENFVKEILPTSKAIDAMGVLAIKPLELALIETEQGYVIDDSILVEPQPIYYSCKQVVGSKDGEYLIIELREKSLVEYAGKMVKEGRMFEFYDENEIWIIRQIGKKIENKFEAVPFFIHNWNRIPVERLKGIPKIVDGEILYQSPFLFAVDNLDLALLNASNLQLSINNCVYVYKVMIGDPCEFTDRDGNKCIDGEIFVEGKSHFCEKCNGTGLKSRMSPLGVLLLKPQTRTQNGELSVQQDPLKYITPDVDCLRFLVENIADHEKRARKILHLQDNNSVVKFDPSNNTATGSDNNLKALIAFVLSISNQEFALYEFALEAIGYMRYGDKFQKPVLTYPQTCDFKTEQDYITEINQANKVGLPPMIIHTMILRYLQNIFTEKDQANVLNLIVATDRLLIMSQDTIDLKLAKGLADKWEDILHTSPIFFVDELLKANPNFFEQDFEAQQTALIDMAKAKADELKASEPNIINDILNAPAKGITA